MNKVLTFCAMWVLGSAAACGTYGLRAVARQALSEDPGAAAAATTLLRAAGPAGLEALFEMHGPLLARPATDPERLRLCAALDRVGAQKDCEASHLYWYTDLAEARAAAMALGRPILSLRLLGKLDEELSCANSRFFRTVLYADRAVSEALRSRFVLHWQTVRPVPRITIDFGDGRKLERTITGNSVHYVLDAAGRPVDALPGLYSAPAFLKGLDRAEGLVRATERMEGAERVEALKGLHADRLERLNRELAADLDRLQPFQLAVHQGAEVLDDETWRRLADRHVAEARLDAGSERLLRRKAGPDARAAGLLAASKCLVEDPMVRMVQGLERSLAEDSLRNEYRLHARIHAWFAKGEVGEDPEILNERVYDEVFLTPSSDPWLGLAPADAYTALEGSGLKEP